MGHRSILPADVDRHVAGLLESMTPLDTPHRSAAEGEAHEGLELQAGCLLLLP